MNLAIETLDLLRSGLTGSWPLYGPMPESILSYITDSGIDKNGETILSGIQEKCKGYVEGGFVPGIRDLINIC
jgi:hypothetical protein